MHISTLDRAKVCSNLRRYSQNIFKLKLKVKRIFKNKQYQKTETNKTDAAYKMGRPEGEEKEKLAEEIFDSTMVENFQNY